MKEVNDINILQREFSTFSAKSENDILKEFRKCKPVRKKMFYFQILSQVKISIINGDISYLLKMNALLVRMRSEVGDLNCLAYRCSPENPLKDVNLIILACKYSQLEVLDFMFSDNCQILLHRPIAVCYNAVLPTDIDECNHNAFYYAIRSGKIKVVQILIEKWPDYYPFKNSGNFHAVLSNAYCELKLKNVDLPIEMEFFIREGLFEEIFYDTCETQESKETFKLEIEKRIEIILSNIATLTSEYKKVDVDETFLCIAKFTAKNIHILKRQLKSTYDKVPWEEMEFCLVIFILIVTQCEEIPLLHAQILCKNRILMHLENFANCLHNTQGIINQTNETALQKLPALNTIIKIDKKPGIHLKLHEACALKIIQINPLLKELYKDYDIVRDEYSLKTMKEYLDLAISVKCDEYGRLIITRALQVVGEHLKNSLISPKLSDTTCEFLQFSLPENTKEIIKGLRNSLSHADSMSKRVEIENGNEDFFNRIQDDLKKLNTAIVEVLCQSKIRVIRKQLKKISECENAEKFKDILKSLHFEYAEKELSEFPILSQWRKLKILVQDLSCIIKEKTQEESALFDEINSKIVLEIDRLDNINAKMKTALNWYNNIISISQIIKFENIKTKAKVLLNETVPEIKWSKANEILVFSEKNWNCARLKLDKNEQDIFKKEVLQWKLVYSVAMELKRMKLIEEYKYNIKENKRNIKKNKSKVHKKGQTDLNNIHKTDIILSLFSQKISQLESVLHNENFKDFPSFKSDRKFQVVVEMLVLDIYSLLEERMSYNHLFLDDKLVTLIGRNMRNHLAHGNTLIQVLLPNALIDIALNAKTISAECTQNIKRKIGKPFRCNINQLLFEHEQDLRIVALQTEMFMALANGNLEIVKNTIQKGADIKGRYIRCKTALHFASGGTSIETVKLVLEEKCDIEAKDEKGRSALHIAARHGRSNIVEYLIKETNIFVDQLDRYNKAPLHIAAEHGHLEVVNILINSKASTAIQDVHGYSPLHYSVLNNHESIVKALLKLEDVENDAFGGVTPLYISSMNGHLGLVNYLISKKANVNAETDRLYVPLHAAVQGGHLEITRALIESGAKVNARCIDGTNALHMASTTDQESVLQLLLQHETDVDDVKNIFRFSPLTFAAQNGNLGIVKLLLKLEAKVGIKDIFGKTPLHFAAENGHQSVVEILIKNKASLDDTDQIGFTAMHFAAWEGHANVVCLLIKYGGNIHFKDLSGSTPLNAAVINGHINVTKVLIDAKADVNNADIANWTALHCCCEKQFLEIAKLLIESKADMHVPSLLFEITPYYLSLGLCSKAFLEAFEGGGAKVDDVKTADFTALHLATVNGDLEVMQYIIDLNCDVNAKSKSGLTALHLAVEQINMAAIELLVENGSNLNVRDNNGYTPLYYAVHRNNKAIVQYLIEKGAIVEDHGFGEPLTSAVAYGFQDIVTILLDSGKFDVNAKLANNGSLLNISVLSRQQKVTKILLQNGADIEAESDKGASLITACFLGDFEIVKLLLSNKEKLKSLSGMGMDVSLYVAVTEGHTDIADILWQAGARNVDYIDDYTNKSALQLAIECSRLEVVKFLLKEKDVDVNEEIDVKLSLLHIAASKNELEIVKCLVDKGVDINVRDINGQKPIIFAAGSGHKDIVEFFHKFSDKDTFQETQALLLAIKNGHLEVTKYLVENCFDVNSLTNDGVTFLHTAAKCNQKDIVLYFLNNGSYYDAYNRSKKTPLQVTECPDIRCALNLVNRLFLSIKCNELTLLKDAIKEGAVLDAKRKDNATPLLYAAWKGYCDILDTLLKNGANPNIVGRGKSTALHYAAKYGHLDIVRSLLSHGAIYSVKSYNGKTPLDYSTQQDVTNLLYLITKCFQSVQNGDPEFLEVLTDPETIKAVMRSRNEKKKLLVTFAMNHDFPKFKQLKQVLKEDSSSMYAEAIEHDNCGRYSESLKLFKNILERRTEVLGCDHPDTLDIKDKIGEVLLMQHDLDEALKIFEENFKTRKESLGANDRSSLHTKMYLAITLNKLGKKAEALKMLEEVFNQQTIIFGKSHSDVLETQILMAVILEQKGNDEEALAQFSTVYELHKESYGESDPISLKIQAEIAMLLSKQKKHDKAIEILKHIYDKHKDIFGSNHQNTLEILIKMAHVYHLKCNFNESLKLYKEVHRAQETAPGPNNLLFLTTLHSMGEVLFSQRKMVGAFKVFLKCHNKCLELMGPKHPLAQEAQKNVEMIKSEISLQYGEASRCILEQMEEASRCAAEGDGRSPEEIIQEASVVYWQRVKSRALYSSTGVVYEKWTENSEEVIRDHFVDFFAKLSRLRALRDGDDNKETETWVDEIVFKYMVAHKRVHSGIHTKFDEIGST